MSPRTVGEIADLIGGRVIGDRDPVIKDAAPIEEAGPGHVTFAIDKGRLGMIHSTGATAVIVPESAVASIEAGKTGVSVISVKDPMHAMAEVLDLFRPLILPSPGIHPQAVVHERASIGEAVHLGAASVVEDGATIGRGCVIFPGVYVGAGVEVGEGSVIYPGVVVREGCTIGARVIIHPNAVVGSDGFGYRHDGKAYRKIPQRGTVRIEDDVEIGAGVTIDRATIGQTIIGRGTKIDNLVQVAHNVRVGPGTVIVAQAGIAGSATIGANVQLGGQSGVNGHITVADGTRVAAKAGVVQDTEPGSILSGFPAIAHGTWLRAKNVFSRLPELNRKVRELEKRLKELEDGREGPGGRG